MKKIIITGGTGRFGSVLKNTKSKYRTFFPTKKKFNIMNLNSIRLYLKLKKPDYLIHLAGLSRPMKIHDENINKSIDLNIIGTANITKACSEKNIKLIYFSTNYVYPGKKGNYKESSPVLPVNNYAWSKLGGEASVQLYKNSLILRVCMTERPFIHSKAFANVKTSFAYHDEIASILFKIIDKKGVINLGGKSQSIYNFAIKDNKYVKKIYLKKKQNLGMPYNSTINLKKINSIIKKSN